MLAALAVPSMFSLNQSTILKNYTAMMRVLVSAEDKNTTTAAAINTNSQTHRQEYVDTGGCTFYTSLDDIYALPDPENPLATCGYTVINPGRPIVLLKVSTTVSYLTQFKRGIDSFVNFATDPKHDHTLVVYLVGNDTLSTLDAPHFGKIEGIQHSLRVHKPTPEWVVFTDLDFLVRNDVENRHHDHITNDGINSRRNGIETTDITSTNATTTTPTVPSLTDLFASVPSNNTSMILQKEKIPPLCSAFHVWKPSAWTDRVLKEWMDYGRSGCCRARLSFYDQMAWFAVLADVKKKGLQMRIRSHDTFSSMVVQQAPNQTDYHMTELPIHGSYWNGQSPAEALFWHTGHERWWRHGYPDLANIPGTISRIDIPVEGGRQVAFY
jgi:hypothetical protein